MRYRLRKSLSVSVTPSRSAMGLTVSVRIRRLPRWMRRCRKALRIKRFIISTRNRPPQLAAGRLLKSAGRRTWRFRSLRMKRHTVAPGLLKHCVNRGKPLQRATLYTTGMRVILNSVIRRFPQVWRWSKWLNITGKRPLRTGKTLVKPVLIMPVIATACTAAARPQCWKPCARKRARRRVLAMPGSVYFWRSKNGLKGLLM